jgi:hypothetical protein
MTRALLLSLLVAAAARADVKAEAEAEMLKAQESFDRGDWEAAIGHFDAARLLVPSSSGPYLGLGLAQARAGRCEHAIPNLVEYLRRKKENPKPEAVRALEACKRLVTPPPPVVVEPPRPAPPPPEPRPEPKVAAALTAPGQLIVEVAPVEARISLNGNEVAASARRYQGPLAAGDYQLLAEKAGWRAAAGTVHLQAGATEQRKLELRPLKHHAWLGVGIAFTVVAAVTGAAALGTYVIANDKPRDTGDYETNKTATLAMQGIFYPTLVIAAAGYTVWAVVNRGRVTDGPPLRVQAGPGAVTVHF